MFYKQIKKLLAEKIPQQSRALIAFKDDSGLVPSNDIKVHNSRAYKSNIKGSKYLFCNSAVTVYIHNEPINIQANTHTYKIEIKEENLLN